MSEPNTRRHDVHLSRHRSWGNDRNLYGRLDHDAAGAVAAFGVSLLREGRGWFTPLMRGCEENGPLAGAKFSQEGMPFSRAQGAVGSIRWRGFSVAGLAWLRL